MPLHQLGRRRIPKTSRMILVEENCGSHSDQEISPKLEPWQLLTFLCFISTMHDLSLAFSHPLLITKLHWSSMYSLLIAQHNWHTFFRVCYITFLSIFSFVRGWRRPTWLKPPAVSCCWLNLLIKIYLLLSCWVLWDLSDFWWSWNYWSGERRPAGPFATPMYGFPLASVYETLSLWKYLATWAF